MNDFYENLAPMIEVECACGCREHIDADEATYSSNGALAFIDEQHKADYNAVQELLAEDVRNREVAFENYMLFGEEF